MRNMRSIGKYAVCPKFNRHLKSLHVNKRGAMQLGHTYCGVLIMGRHVYEVALGLLAFLLHATIITCAAAIFMSTVKT